MPSPIPSTPRLPFPDEFLTRKLLNGSEASGECRVWLKGKRGGYGRVWNGRRVEDTHRLAYRLFVGPITEGKDVLHRCDNPACWEPSHLFLGTQADNNADRHAKGRGGGWKLRGVPRGPSHMRGADHPRSKLTESEAKEILALARQANRGGPVPTRYIYKRRLSVAAVARAYGVSDSLVHGIISGRNWAWL